CTNIKNRINPKLNLAIATQLSGLGDDGRRKRSSFHHKLSTHHSPRQRVRPDPSSGTCAADKKL
ncbi:hypothetical protein, partial [Pedobacter petrophilus]|uniref:hypothetical protein n=1 Tax=Pedobacter petrophilus TaxID=1908241 RepID=UPI001ADEE55A